MVLAQQGRLRQSRIPEREEEARKRARSSMRQIEAAWADYLSLGMATGAIPQADPQLLTRAVLGLYNSVWIWYRPGGALELPDVARFYVDRQLDVIGCDPELAARWLAAAA